MRKTIKDLKLKAGYYSEKIERLITNETQNTEVGDLVNTIVNSHDGQQSLDKIYAEADSIHMGLGGALKEIWTKDCSDWTQFQHDQATNKTGRSTNKWSSITIRMCLAIFSRRPSAYHALKSLGIFQLPCDKILKGYMSNHTNSPGIREDHLLDSAQKYDLLKQERVKAGFVCPVGEGVLMWDEVKVQSRIIWNSSNSSILGFAMSSDDFGSLHDVYEGLCEDEKCQKTVYVVQFLWRDLSSNFDVAGPYFNCSSTMEVKFLHSMVVRTMLAFSQFGFHVRALLSDGASSNLSLLKLLCGYVNNEDKDIEEPWFQSPFDGRKVYLLVCPSHQLKNMIAVLYNSRIGGTKEFIKRKTRFGWSTIESVYKADLFRAQNGVSRRVPGLKYAHVVRDSWTRLNVLPAKIMQQPYMIAAIKEIAEKKDLMREANTCTAEYLQACNFIFERGILSHEKIVSLNSETLANITKGMKWFFEWKEVQEEPDIKFRSPLQKMFLAWQTWDLLLIMHYGFKGLCEDFLTTHPNCFIAPIRVNGSAIESIFSSLKYIAGGNLSSTNYATSLSSLITQRNVHSNPHVEKGYRTDIRNIN